MQYITTKDKENLKEKQIEEMARIICENTAISCYETAVEIAEELTVKDYRKAPDVAREIFEEIDKEINLAIDSNYRAKKEYYNHSIIPNYDNFIAMCDGKIYAMRGLLDFMDELKNKYTESEDKE